MNKLMKKTRDSLFSKALLKGLTISTLLLLAACGSPTSVDFSDPVNQPPIADAGNDSNVAIGSSVALDGSNSSDAENNTLSYDWNISSKPSTSSAVLLNSTSVSSGFIADVAGIYVVQLVVTDRAADSAVDEVVITVGNAGNLPPIANAGINAIVAVGASVNLDGSNSSDPEGTDLIYKWTLSSKPDASNAMLSNVISVRPSFVADTAGAYVIQLIVNDGSADSAVNEVVITAKTQNIRPIANAGDDKIVAASATITIDGGTSFDPNGDTLRYFWSVITPDGNRELNISRAVTANYVPATPGDYIFELLIIDTGSGEYRDIDETRITVATRIISLSWPANTDSPTGYAIYAGPDAGSTNNLVRILQKGDTRWNPASPGIQLGWETVLRAAGLALDATKVCLAVRAYNGFGVSDLSVSSCYTKP